MAVKRKTKAPAKKKQKVYKRKSKSKVVYSKGKQTGTSDKKSDQVFKALPPGKRKVKGAKRPYYEYRKNRTDAKGLTGAPALSENEIKFLKREAKNNKGYKYKAKVLFGEYVIIKETEKGTPRKKWIFTTYESADYIAKELNKNNSNLAKINGCKI